MDRRKEEGLMASFARTDTSLLGQWWWTVDRWMLASVIALMAIGALLILAASPAVAENHGSEAYYFVIRQFLFLIPATGLLITFSLMGQKTLRRVGVLLFITCLVLTFATLFIGVEIKGSRRWIDVGILALQPSEFLKPGFVIFTAWMFAEQRRNPKFPGRKIAFGCLAAVLVLLINQPDIGQSVLITSVWLAQLFMAGLGWLWIVSILGGGLTGIVALYFIFPHVASRIDRFLDPSSGDTYQIDTALNAFRSGGLLGKGLGEGTVKHYLPDAHSDFIFAVAGEEFGMIACLILIGIFAFVVFRGLLHLFEESDHFSFFAVGGLTTLFGVQAIINMGVNLDLLPAKGMTLPLISYGGSSLLAMGIVLGMLLSLTRRQVTARRRSVWP
jgi:cell division protein FtsW